MYELIEKGIYTGTAKSKSSLNAVQRFLNVSLLPCFLLSSGCYFSSRRFVTAK